MFSGANFVFFFEITKNNSEQPFMKHKNACAF